MTTIIMPVLNELFAKINIKKFPDATRQGTWIIPSQLNPETLESEWIHPCKSSEG